MRCLGSKVKHVPYSRHEGRKEGKRKERRKKCSSESRRKAEQQSAGWKDVTFPSCRVWFPTQASIYGVGMVTLMCGSVIHSQCV